MDDFHHVAIGKGVVGMAAARDDLAVHLHGDPAFGQALGGEQFGDGAGGGQGERVAIESDVHAGIVARLRAGCPAMSGKARKGPGQPGLFALESPGAF